MANPKQFVVYDIVTGEQLAVGTAAECGERLGTSDKTIRRIAIGEIKSREYMIVEKIPQEAETAEADAARKWEAFAAPIRKKYGIPVYKPERKREG